MKRRLRDVALFFGWLAGWVCAYEAVTTPSPPWRFLLIAVLTFVARYWVVNTVRGIVSDVVDAVAEAIEQEARHADIHADVAGTVFMATGETVPTHHGVRP